VRALGDTKLRETTRIAMSSWVAWVNHVVSGPRQRRPYYPNDQTLSTPTGSSGKCQEQTSGGPSGYEAPGLKNLLDYGHPHQDEL